jgi:hypothetical protein
MGMRADLNRADDLIRGDVHYCDVIPKSVRDVEFFPDLSCRNVSLNLLDSHQEEKRCQPNKLMPRH